MPSEIEIVSDANDQKQNATPNPSQVAIADIFSASAYGDFEKVRKFVENDGVSVSRTDGNGYYALQWAALNNFADIVQYIIHVLRLVIKCPLRLLFQILVFICFLGLLVDFSGVWLKRGADVNASDNVGQTALHWAAARGSIAAADELLQNGARVEAADNNGYRAVHVAAQYGQTAFLNHVIAKYHGEFDVPDNDGRSPLHWAAYKGYSDTVRLLLFRDAYQGRQDKEGCTPLHWAVLGGNMEACTVMVHTGTKEELFVKDQAGFTPVQLAFDKGHRHIGLSLVV